MSAIDKVIEIKCKGSMTIPLEDIVIIQGDLKTLTEDNYKKLRNTIITEGYCDPLNLWFDPKINKWCSLDGTQRTFVLKGLKADGYLIPPIPANEIMAKDRKEAMKLILTFSSNYGKLTDDGLSNFCIDAGIEVDFLESSVFLPEVNIDYFTSEQDDISNTSKELSLDEFSNLEHKCPKCGFEWNGGTVKENEGLEDA